VDVQKKLDEIVEAVGNARAMPMSASCVVNRADLLSMLDMEGTVQRAIRDRKIAGRTALILVTHANRFRRDQPDGPQWQPGASTFAISTISVGATAKYDGRR